MNKLQEIKKLTVELFKSVGYNDEYLYDINDQTGFHWKLDEDEDEPHVEFGEGEDQIGCYYDHAGLSRGVDQWVYRGEEFTMLLLRYSCNSQIYANFFLNELEVK